MRFQTVEHPQPGFYEKVAEDLKWSPDLLREPFSLKKLLNKHKSKLIRSEKIVISPYWRRKLTAKMQASQVQTNQS